MAGIGAFQVIRHVGYAGVQLQIIRAIIAIGDRAAKIGWCVANSGNGMTGHAARQVKTERIGHLREIRPVITGIPLQFPAT